jgi:putative transposase
MGNKIVPFEAGEFYHLYNHGIGDENIFKESKNYDFCLDKFFDYLDDIISVYSYCLMPNHFHFLIRIKESDTVQEFFSKKYPDKDPRSFQNPSSLIAQQMGNFFKCLCKGF